MKFTPEELAEINATGNRQQSKPAGQNNNGFTADELAEINSFGKKDNTSKPANLPLSSTNWKDTINPFSEKSRYGNNIAGRAITLLDKIRATAWAGMEQGADVLKGKGASWEKFKHDIATNRNYADRAHENIDAMTPQQVENAYGAHPLRKVTAKGWKSKDLSVAEKRQALKNNAAVTGFFVDNAVDVLATGGIGKIAKAAKATRAGVKVANWAKDAKWVAQNLPGVSKVFGHTTGVEAIDDALAQSEMLHNAAKRTIKEDAVMLKNLHTKSGGKLTLSDIETHGRQMLKNGTPEQKAFVEKIIANNADDVAKAKRFNVKLNPIEDENYVYMSHILNKADSTTKKTLEQLAEDSTRYSGLPSDKTVHGLQRKYVKIKNLNTGEYNVGNLHEVYKRRKAAHPELRLSDIETLPASAKEVNDYIWNKYGKIKEMFSDDPILAHTLGRLETQKAFKDAADWKIYSDAINQLPMEPKGFKSMFYRKPNIKIDANLLNKEGRLPQYLVDTLSNPEKLSELANTKMNNALASRLEDYIYGVTGQTQRSPIGQSVLNGLHNFNDMFKTFTLQPRFKYHARNWESDLINMYYGGVNPANMPKDIYGAYRVLHGNPDKTIKIAGKEMRVGDVKNLIEDYGVVDNGELNSMLNNIDVTDGSAIQKTWKQKTKDVMGKFGKVISGDGENVRHAAMYIDGLNKGMTPLEAAKYTKNALYDYSSHTPAEGLLKEIFPFFMYERYNVPFQTKLFANAPVKAKMIPRAKEAIEYAVNNGDVVPEEKRPDWIRNQFSIQAGKNEQGKDRYYTLNNSIPSAELFQELNTRDIIDKLWSSTTPLINTPFKYIRNYDPFRHKPVDELASDINGLSGLAFGVDKTRFLNGYAPAYVPLLADLTGAGAVISDITRIFTPEREMSDTDKAVSFMTGIRPYYKERNEQELRDLREAKNGTRYYEPGVSIAKLRNKIRNSQKYAPELTPYYMQLLQKQAERIRQQQLQNLYY